MQFDRFAGNWIYRSFINRDEVLPQLDPSHLVAADVEKWSRYLFGQGVMVLHPSVTGGLTGLFKMGTGGEPLDMRLLGKIDPDGGQVWFRWNAQGIASTPSDGWLYEYEGYLVNNWPDGSNQVEAIVGTVIRSQNHDDLAPNQRLDTAARRGRVGSFIMVRVAFKTARTTIPLPPELLETLASRHSRLHHCLWHGARDNWNDPNYISDADKHEITRLGWAPPRPNQLPTRGTASGREPDNGAGEDFLFMHRQMIGQVKAKLTALGLPLIQSWQSPPAPIRDSYNSDGYSVPPAWDRHAETNNEGDMKSLGTIKSDEYWSSRMSFLDRKFKDANYLATLTLDQFGAKIEWLIHNLMHIRWCSQPIDPETGLVVPSGRPERSIDEKWVKHVSTEAGPDGVVIQRVTYYDDLNDTFSSHVHPVFWRLHGWVDDRINDWFVAHEHLNAGEVVRAEVNGVSWFAPGKWVSVAAPWVGPAMMHGHEGNVDHMAHEVQTMERVHQLIFNPDVQPGKTKATSKISVKSLRSQ